MFSSQVATLSVDKLKKLNMDLLSFISGAADSEDVRKKISEINHKISKEESRQKLRQIMINLLEVVKYWDTHHDTHMMLHKRLHPYVINMLDTSMTSKAHNDKDVSILLQGIVNYTAK